MQICVALFTLMVGVFVHPDLVIEPGLAQIAAALLILIATIGITFSLQARFAERKSIDMAIRLVLAAIALVALLYPSGQVAALACLPVVLIIGYWFFREHSGFAPDEVTSEGQPAPIPYVGRT